MMFAFINDFKVAEIKELSSVEDADSLVYQFQSYVDVTGWEYGPEIGWLWSNGSLRADLHDVTPRQIRQALLLSGVSTEMILGALNSLPEPTKSFALVEWEYSTAFIRTNPLVQQVGIMLGWSTKQLDDLWRLAGSL